MFFNTRVISGYSIPRDILTKAVRAEYKKSMPSKCVYWSTSWRSSEGGNPHRNSPEHTALSHYLIENGCEPDERVIISF